MSGIRRDADQRVERQAHRALRAYPALWRFRHGDALVGTLLDAAEAAGRHRLTPGEVLDVVRHGLGERFRGVAGSRLVRFLAGAAVAVAGGTALAALVLGEIAPALAGNADWLRASELLQAHAGWGGPFGGFPTTGPLLYLAWILLLGAVAVGHRPTVRVAALVTATVALVLPGLSGALGAARPPLVVVAGLGWLALLIAITPGQVLSRWRFVPLVGAVALAGGMLALRLPGVLSPRDGEEFTTHVFYMSIRTSSRLWGLDRGVVAGIAVLASAVTCLFLAAALGRAGSDDPHEVMRAG